MKLQSLSVILVLGVMGFAEVVNGICLVTNSLTPKVYWYRCYASSNYSADVKAAPVDIQKVAFSNAKIEVLRNRSFARLSSGLEELAIHHSEIGGIEDNAFEGLTKLHTLSFNSSNLKIVKGVWFEGLTNLKRVLLRDNEIEHVECSFFSTVPPLESLDLSENRLEYLYVESFADFKTTEILIDANPLSWMSRYLLLDSLIPFWTKRTSDMIFIDRRPELPPHFVFTCAKKIMRSQLTVDQETMNNCVENTVARYLKSEDNYTVEELCQTLRNHETPYLCCREMGPVMILTYMYRCF